MKIIIPLVGIQPKKDGNNYPFIDLKSSNLTEVEYPTIDIHDLPFKKNSFDVVISDQVLEHIEAPHKAIEESNRVLRSDGIAIHTTCFMNYIHFCPKDYWRLSPDALRKLCKSFSDILCCAGWGNRFAILLCFLSHRFRAAKIPERKSSLLRLIASHNEKQYPIVTWVIAKK